MLMVTRFSDAHMIRLHATSLDVGEIPGGVEDARVVHLVEALRDAKADCKVVLPWGPEIRLGGTQPRGADGFGSEPRFELELKNKRPLQEPLTQLTLGSAYI